MINNLERHGHNIAAHTPTNLTDTAEFVLKMVHYGDQPEHFNAIIDPNDQQYLVREQLKMRLEIEMQAIGTFYWWPRIDVYAIAKEILPIHSIVEVDNESTTESNASTESSEITCPPRKK